MKSMILINNNGKLIEPNYYPYNWTKLLKQIDELLHSGQKINDLYKQQR